MLWQLRHDRQRLPAGAVPCLDGDRLGCPDIGGSLIAAWHGGVGGAGEDPGLVVEEEKRERVDTARDPEIEDQRLRCAGRGALPAVGWRPQIPGNAVGERRGGAAGADRAGRDSGEIGAVVVDRDVHSRRLDAGFQSIVNEPCRDERRRDRRKRRRQSPHRRRRGDHAAVGEKMEAGAEAVARAVAIPHDSDLAAPIDHPIEAEEIPFRRKQWANFERVVGAGNEAGKPRDHEIGVARMEVMLAVVVGIVAVKAAGVWMAGFCKVRPPGLAVGAGIGVEERDVVLGRHHLLKPRAIIAEAGGAELEDVGEGLERLRRGEGPALAAPPAAVGLEDEHRIMPLDRGRPKGSLEELRIDQIFPSLFITLAPRWHVELPGDVADQLAAVGAAGEAACIVDPASGFDGNAVKRFVVAEGGNEETAPLVPQRRFHLLSQRLRGGPVGGGLGGLPEQILHSRKRLEIGPLVGDEARPIARRATEDVGRLPATDVELHPVVVPHLPIKPGRGDEVAVVPALRVCLETGKDVAREDGRRCGGRVAGGAEVEPCGMDEMNAPHRVGKPGGIVARLGAGGVHPVPGVIAGDPRRPQPAGLGELVAGRAGDGAIRPRPGRPVEKLGEQVSAVR